MNAEPIDDDPGRRAIKVWMRDVLQQKGWSANEWARRAGTSPTNITRFLSPTSSIVPSGSTIAKLARAAGSQPRMSVNLNLTPACNVSYVSSQLLKAFGTKPLWDWLMTPAAQASVIAIDGPLDGPAFVADVPSHGMVGRGIQPGDRILVERVKPVDLVPGHVILFLHDGEPMVGEWQGSMVVFYPAMQSPAFAPLRSSGLEIYGRVRRLIREL